jgi:EAL domain-containing protein (putative c-di-GMP-specific phosphodiesterase class I)/FixJ family two-component response regulator
MMARNQNEGARAVLDRSEVSVMVLDDEPFILKLMGRVLVQLGFDRVTTCGNGPAALQWVDAQQTCDLKLILCDLNMPEMDGVEFLRKLVDHRYNGALVFISGEDERALQATEKLARAHDIMVLGALPKPVEPHRLERLVALWSPHSPCAPRENRKCYDADAVRTAIDSGQLINHFQPQVCLATGKVIGVESLVRWYHPEDGMVYPDRFIGVAEENGLIDDLTRVVVAGAFAQARHWQVQGLTLRMAVNVSMDNLASLDFPDYVATQAAASGISSRNVVLEVTESRLPLDLRAPLEILTRLRLKRFGLSIDDFGTGHSSMKQLRDMPFDELKIDGSFVHGAASRGLGTELAIYDASLGLAKQLDMQTVAEGIEDRADWDMVRRSGCHMAQGYFIAQPMPAADVPGWMASWTKRVQDETLLAEPRQG